MNGGSTIIEFWREDQDTGRDGQQEEDILLLDQSVTQIVGADETSGSDRARGLAIALALVAGAWAAFAIWALVASGGLTASPASWIDAVTKVVGPLALVGILYLLLLRNSRAESRRYLDTAQALRNETDRLNDRLDHIVGRLESARRTMQDQAELLDSYGAAASSNMEASAELISSRARATAEGAEAAEQAGLSMVRHMQAMIDAMPDLEERSSRMAALILDNGHALGERIDTLEARLAALTEVSDEARSRTLTATKSLASQLSQLQESARAATDEVNGMADIASARIEATANGARLAMADRREEIDTQSALIDAMIGRAGSSFAETTEQVRKRLAEELADLEARVAHRIDAALDRARASFATTDEGLTRRADALEALVTAARQGIDAVSERARETLARDIDAIDGDVRGRMDDSLARAHDALAASGEGLAAQTEALDALIARSRDTLDAIGTRTVADLGESVTDIEVRLHQLTDLMEGQRRLLSGLHEGLQQTIETTDRQFGALEDSGMAKADRLTAALNRLTQETQRIDAALEAGGVTAERLIGNAESLMLALDSSVRELDETYPGALGRFDSRMEQSRSLIGATTPEMERLEAISQALVGRAEEAESLLRGQGARLTEWLESTQGGLHANRELVERLRVALDGADQDARRITEGAGPLLVTALLRVKETADQAAERARQALGRAIPDAAQNLAEASDEALKAVVDRTVATQIEQVAQVAEEAVSAAHQASERLTRQLLTIADTSANVEKRIAEAQEASENRDRDHFARRSALLIESLNSTAIDVAKILSNDITDSAWSAYLKGDRGVFTRRAVRLLDTGESREIALHYDEDAEFRDHVNRYIHDFEAMLRVILSARDGNALGVAILSSDMGKLYVALAQAIERLRQ